MSWERVFSRIKDVVAILFDFHPSGQISYFNGLHWDFLPANQDLIKLEDWIDSLLEVLSGDVRLKHKNQMPWRAVIEHSGQEYICHYSHEYHSLRVSRAPSRKARLEDWGLAENQVRSLSLPGQITIISGPPLSGKSTIQKLFFRLAEQYGALPLWKTTYPPLPSPRLWLFGDETQFSPQEAVELGFRGQSVCLSFESLDLETCLTRFFSRVEESYQDRLVQQLNVIETRLLPGEDQLVVPFTSFYQLRYCPSTIVEKKDWAALQTWNEGSKDSLNIRSLNQSILQGVIRRKIDLETAFAASPYPEGLDMLLKRIGI